MTENKSNKTQLDSSNFKQNPKTEVVIKKDTFIAHPTGYKDISKFCDTTINNIKFNDCHTIAKLFGDKFELLPDIDDLPSLEIINKGKTQLLTMFMFNGSAKCHFEQYQVEYLATNKKFLQKPFATNDSFFVTGRQIHLGITKDDLKLKLGKPNEIKTQNGQEVYSYQQYNDL